MPLIPARKSSVVLAFAAIVAIAGCTPKPPEQPPESKPAGWPSALNDLTITWTAESGIDLTAGPVVAVRAYLESYYLAFLTDDEKFLYRGFREAVDSDGADGAPAAQALWLEPSSASAWVGTARHHLLRIEQAGQDVTVVGCFYSYGTGRRGNDGGYKPNLGADFGPDAGISPLRIGLRAPETDESNLPAQEGPSRAPVDNVFNGWQVTSHEGGYLAKARWVDVERDRAECVAQEEGPPKSRSFSPTSEYPRSDFPTLPATPGWPEKPAS